MRMALEFEDKLTVDTIIFSNDGCSKTPSMHQGAKWPPGLAITCVVCRTKNTAVHSASRALRKVPELGAIQSGCTW